MNQLTEPVLEAFLERFWRFHDAVIRSYRYAFRGTDDARSSILVDISVQDAQSQSGWSNIRLQIVDVAEFTFEEGRTTNQVISTGIYVGWFDGLIYVDFSPYSTEMETVDDVRHSTFYVAGSSCSWEALPLTNLSV